MSKKLNDIQKKDILQFINKGDWPSVFELLKKEEITDINDSIVNGDNLFHLACIKGDTKVIKTLLKMKNDKKIKLNTYSLNADGLPAIHLYYRFGGTDPSLLADKDVCYVDNESNVLAKHLMDQIDLLEILINRMIDENCLDNIGLRNDDSLLELLVMKVVHYANLTESDENTKIKNRYIAMAIKLFKEIKSPGLIYMGIHYNSIDIIISLIELGVDFYVHEYSGITPLAKCVDSQRIELLFIILEYTKRRFGYQRMYEFIHASEIDYASRPINIAIKVSNIEILKIIINFILEFEENAKTITQFNQTDMARNTYLHRLITHPQLNMFPINIIEFFIQRTNLNFENYAGITSAHLLFGSGLWKVFKNILKGREIDLLKVDDTGNNCYSYVKPEDKGDFMEFTKEIKIPLVIKYKKDIERMFGLENVKDMLYTNNRSLMSKIKTLKSKNRESAPDISDKGDNSNEKHISINKVRSRNYGLFNSNMHHYMLYMRYLENKHKSMFIPTQRYIKKNIIRDKFFYDMVSSYTTSTEHRRLVENVRLYQAVYYSYLPHNIYWIDGDRYFVHPRLESILKEHDKTVTVETQRYVMIKVTMVITDTLLHANVLIYDRHKKEAWRFEPYGTTRVKAGDFVDDMLYELLKRVYGDITYNRPDDFLSGLNFQMVDGEDYVVNKNLGDPGGYCLAWSIWFLDIILSHPEKDIKQIMHNFFDRSDISAIISDEEGENIASKNYYLDFIRRYAHRLDEEKNNILTGMGIKKYYLYNSVFTDEVTDKLEEMFKVGQDITPTDDTQLDTTPLSTESETQ